MISVLLPSRGRPEKLRKSIGSLLDGAHARSEVEILVATDPDDETMALASLLDLPPQVHVYQAPERFGYARLHEYVNYLAGVARGDWLMLWNDDAYMGTSGWDGVISDCKLSQCLFMDAVYPCQGERGNIFPVWPRAWTRETGYVSLSPNIDVWISEVAIRAGCMSRIPVRAVHERAHEEDGTADQTHLDGRAAMGEGNDPEYHSTLNRMARSPAVRTVMGLNADVAA